MPATTRRRTWDKCLLDAPQDFKEVKKKFTENKSWFEERREENLKANAAFLASLNIDDAKLKLKPKVEPKSLSSRGIKTKSVMEPRTYELRPVRVPSPDHQSCQKTESHSYAVYVQSTAVRVIQ
ncbi:hypothetical protein EB796_000395 [Bugula neritina]|uniref:Uncharacterized protein n=1 Tax=Bugula neritina TaxID=10212 RepID=A0A7J7KT48_BUGNE|nr:hypothetical protein EB796_000395 [Bugula neritina]